MAKYHGRIGFGRIDNESNPGVSIDTIVEREYYGEVIRNARRSPTADKVNNDITLSNELSILLDPYLMDNYYNIRYVTFMGSKWSITNVEMRYPRIIIDIGGLYNEQEEDGDPSYVM